MASSGTWPAWEESYRLEVIGSQPNPLAAVAPQQLLPPLFTRQGCLAILFFDYFLNIGTAHGDPFSYLQSWTISCGLTALFRVQHSA